MSPTPASPYGPRAEAGPPGLAAKLLGFCEELRSEGVAVGTSEILDAFAALEQVPWTSRDDFREALATTIAKSQEDRRIFELLFERWFFRAAEAEAVERGIERGGSAATRAVSGSTSTSCASRSARRSSTGDDGEMRDLARLAIAAFGRQGEGSGVVGVDVQRIRRTLGLSGGDAAPAEDGAAELPPIDREQLNRFERHLRRELERDLIERTSTLPPSRPLAELDRALPTSPTQDLAAVHRAVSQMKRRLATLGHEQRGRRKGRDGRRAADDARLAGDRRRADAPALPAEAPAPARDLRPLRRLHLGHLGQRLLPLGPARPARLVPQAAQLRLHRADLRGDRGLRARARLPRHRPADLQRGRASPTSPATPTTAASGSSSSARSPTSSTRARP